MASTDSQSPRAASRRTERSCIICHRRKVRCDKQSPCSQCSQSGYSCQYPQAGPVRRVRKTTITDVASRISDLERTVAAVSRKQGHNKRNILPLHTSSNTVIDTPHVADGPGVSQTRTDDTASSHATSARADAARHEPMTRLAPGPRQAQRYDSGRADDSGSNEVLLRKGSSSQYINEVLFSRVIEQEDDVRSALSTPGTYTQQSNTSPFNPMGILSRKSYEQSLASHLPPKHAAITLWRVYVDRVDPCFKILHVPTDEVTIYTVIDNPDHASAEAIAMCYAVCFSAVVALGSAEVAVLLEDDKYTCLSRFKMGVEQAFAHSELLESPTLGLVQALAIYLGAVRVHNSGRGIWILHGLAIRAAESIGLHRDGKRLGLSPFESEIRRRLWWHLVTRDGRAAEDHGFKDTFCPGIGTGVAIPLNLEDVDLSPNMRDLPAPRSGWTPMTLTLTISSLSYACGRLLEARPDTREQRVAMRAQVFSDAYEKMEDILKLCNYVVPEQRMTIKIARFMLRKTDLVYRQRESMSKPGDLATEENLLEAMEILEEAEDIWEDDLLRPFRWLIRSYPQFHMMLYILWHLCVRPQGPSTERALAIVEYHCRNGREADACAANESKWIVLKSLKAKAISIMNSSKDQAHGPRVEGTACSIPSQPPGYAEGPDKVWKNEMEMGREAGFDDTQGGMLDWGTLLEDFQLDAADLSMI